MKIRTKLIIEVLILVVLIGTVSVFSITNTRQLQEGYNELKVDTLPALDNLRDMRVASTLLTSATMEILLLTWVIACNTMSPEDPPRAAFDTHRLSLSTRYAPCPCG